MDKGQFYQMMQGGGSAFFGGGLQAPPAPAPFFGQNMLGPQLTSILNMFMPQLTEMLRQPFGGFGFNFSGQNNIYQNYEGRRWTEESFAARKDAANRDAGLIGRGLQGFYSAAAIAGGANEVFRKNPDGTRTLRPEYVDWLNRAGGDFAQMMPFLAAIAPDDVDNIFGVTGLRSASIDLFMSSSRFIFNKKGIPSGVDAAQLQDKIFDRLFEDGTNHRVAGISSRRVGELFQQLTAGGMIQGGDDIESIARQASEQIEKHSKSIAAINDIFTGQGITNSPMSELVKGLKTLTGMGLGDASADHLTKAARDIEGAIRYNPMGLPFAMNVSNSMGQLAGAMGFRSTLVGEMTPHIMAGNNARAMMGYKYTTDSLSPDQFLANEMGKTAGAATSPLANTVGAILNLADFAKEGSPLKALAEQIKSGRLPPELTDGRAQAYLAQVAQQSGVGSTQMMQQVYYGGVDNASAMARNPSALRAVTSDGQSRELQLKVGRHLRGLGIDHNTLMKALMDASAVAEGDIDFVKKTADLLGRGGDSQFMVALKVGLSTFGTEEARAAGLAIGSDEAKAKSALNQFRGANEQYLERQREQRKRADDRGRISGALTGEGRGSWAGRLWKEFVGMGSEPDADAIPVGGVMGTLLRIGGMVTKATVDDRVREVFGSGKDYSGILDTLLNEKEPPKTDKAAGEGSDTPGTRPSKDGSSEDKAIFVKVVSGGAAGNAAQQNANKQSVPNNANRPVM